MLTTTQNDILFDDAALLKNRLGKEYLTITAENLSPDCNCSGYTSIEDDEEFSEVQISARNTNRYCDCTNN